MKNPSSPPFALRLLAWFCPAILYESIEGDLLEQFEEDIKIFGEKRARRRLTWNVIKFFRPGIVLRNRIVVKQNNFSMLFNHLRFSIRLFSKDKIFSTLNILGLALGIAVSIILLLIVNYDFTYDQHYINHERIYRLGGDYFNEANATNYSTARSARQLCEVLKDQFPEIEAVTRVIDFGNATGNTLIKTELKGKEIVLDEPYIFRSDSDYFKVFNYEFIAGDSSTCFKDPSSAVFTQSTAKRLFGEEDPIGKTFTIDGIKKTWSVSGIIADLPPNTHLKFNILLSGIELANSFQPGIDSVNSMNYWGPDVYMYMLMPVDYDVNRFNAKWPPINDTYFKPVGDKIGSTHSPILQSLDSIHFGPALESDQPIGNIKYLYTICGIGFLIVLLACINYANLSTAKASKRAAEIGMKKTLGSGKGLLTTLLLSESIVLSLLSLLIALLFVFVIINSSPFNDLIGRELSIDTLSNPYWVGVFIGLAFLIGILSGIYPAFHLTQIPTIGALKGTYNSKKTNQFLRKGLITTQFVVSMLVILCTLFMHDQIAFMRNSDVGFNKDNILVINLNDSRIMNQFQTFKNETLQNSNVIAATTIDVRLGAKVQNKSLYLVETEEGVKHKGFTYLRVGEDFLKVFDVDLIAGREPVRYGENPDYFCNETAAKMMGWESDVVEKKVSYADGSSPGQIVGMIKDFNFNSFHHPVEPLLIDKQDNISGFLYIKISGNIRETVKYIEKTWTKYGISPFEYNFLDAQFDAQYRADEKQYELISVLSYICIFISLLGIIGLSAFTAIQRTKEIGIRKVLGANVGKIIFLLSKDILLLVLLSGVIVVPLSYWLMNVWLQNFAYKTELNYLLYGVVTCTALLFVFVTVFLQSYKTAITNPVKSLKYE